MAGTELRQSSVGQAVFLCDCGGRLGPDFLIELFAGEVVCHPGMLAARWCLRVTSADRDGATEGTMQRDIQRLPYFSDAISGVTLDNHPPRAHIDRKNASFPRGDPSAVARVTSKP